MVIQGTSFLDGRFVINDSLVLMVNPSDLAGGQISPANMIRGLARMTEVTSKIL